ncbi:MAG: exodeoxyribonuclease V subunit gamma, partial [Acidimicrobiia bacterium]
MLHIHRAERADGLVEMLGTVLSTPLEDPMDPEVIAVPTRGIERWLTQRLSGRLGASPGRSDGVCANVEFPFPATLVGRAAATAAGVDSRMDPWLPERAVWPLLAIVDQCLAESWLAPLATHLSGTGPEPDPARSARRFPILRHVADLFERYGVHRPEMLQSWARKKSTDGLGRPLPEDARWQAELWRRLRERIDTPSPAERLETACSRLRADPSVVDLPPRFSLFGLTRLPPIHLQILEALADGRQVHLFLLHPSPVLWDRLAREAQSGPAGDAIAGIPRHPLLASWGRDSREMQLVLLAGRGEVPGEHHPLRERQDTLLHRIQADIHHDRQPPGEALPGDQDARMILESEDRSIQVHACHGRARQVEVLRDAILQLLADDPGLEPRDIVVMCPDVEAFAPLVQATFGAREIDLDDVHAATHEPSAPAGTGREHPPADLRVRLADRSLRQTNPVLGVVSQLLDLVATRLTAPQVLDLAGREPVRRRFGFTDDDLARIEEWVAATGIRWGLDGPHRAPYGLEALDANTWRAGLDRVLLGVAMSEDDNRLFGGVLPYDDVESGAVDLAGRFAEFVDRLQRSVVSLAGPLPLSGWVVEIAATAEALTST